MVARKTLDQMLRDVLSRHSYSYGQNPTFEAQTKGWINDAYAEIVGAYEWPQLKKTVELGLRKGSEATLFDLETEESGIPLPADSYSILSFEIYTPHYRTVQHVTPGELYRRAQTAINTLGPPEYMAIVGQTAQYRKNPTDDATLTVKSDVSGTNDTLTARIYYRPKNQLSGTAAVWEDVSGDFNTGIALTSTVTTGYPVEQVVLPAGWLGNLTIEDSAGTPNELVRIDPREVPGTSSANSNWRVYTRHLARLWPIPSVDGKAAITYMLDPPPLTENEDVPLIPVSQVLVELATAEGWRKRREADMARDAEGKAEKVLARVIPQQQRVQKVIVPYAGNVNWMNGIYW